MTYKQLSLCIGLMHEDQQNDEVTIEVDGEYYPGILHYYLGEGVLDDKHPFISSSRENESKKQ